MKPYLSTISSQPTLPIGDQLIDVDQIENPVVNPIIGAHRSAATVRNELRAHQATLRQHSAIPAIFQADYLFVNVCGKGVRLGRVTRAPYGGSLDTKDVVDVTEYEHTPQPGVAGFFGTFKPLHNAEYDAHTRGSLAYVRHRDVKREDVVVFNVQVFGRAASDLRVSLESLRELQRAMPDIHSVPQSIPSTHKAAQSQPQSSSQSRGDAGLNGRPAVANGARIEVYWEEDPEGWFSGVATSSRREDGTWVTRVKYDPCPEFPSHAEWHILDTNHEDHVTWRLKAT